MANRIVLVSLKGISLGERPRVDAVVSSACNKHGLFKRRDGLLVMSTSAVEHSDYKQVVGVLRRLAARLEQLFRDPLALLKPSHCGVGQAEPHLRIDIGGVDGEGSLVRPQGRLIVSPRMMEISEVNPGPIEVGKELRSSLELGDRRAILTSFFIGGCQLNGRTGGERDRDVRLFDIRTWPP